MIVSVAQTLQAQLSTCLTSCHRTGFIIHTLIVIQKRIDAIEQQEQQQQQRQQMEQRQKQQRRQQEQKQEQRQRMQEMQMQLEQLKDDLNRINSRVTWLDRGGEF